ncbi:MAG: LptA/OstA family protein [Armatimonadota bacterium]|nr:LptA/OstA family protein [Armatimonadota bacterium]
MRRCLSAVVVGSALACLPVPPALAQAVSPAPAATPGGRPPLHISADEMHIDAATRVAVAVGRVRISDGTTTATAARATLYHREGRGVLAGQARVRGPQGLLEGDEITVWYTARAITRIVARGAASLEAEASLVTARVVTIAPSADTVTAEREVTLFVPPDVVATGARLVYQRARGTAVLEGRGRVANPDGFIEADRIEGTRRMASAVATGDVWSVFRDIEVRSRTAELVAAEQKAVFVGDVRVAQPGRRMTSERVTLWYGVGRVVAEGQTWMRLEPQP